MFDIGWLELLLIAITALIVVGPKELPGLFRTVGRFMGRARGMAREFQRSMEQAADESGLQDAASSLKSLNRSDFGIKRPTARNVAKSLVGDDDAKAGEKPPTSKTASDRPAPDKPAAGTPGREVPPGAAAEEEAGAAKP